MALSLLFMLQTTLWDHIGVLSNEGAYRMANALSVALDSVLWMP